MGNLKALSTLEECRWGFLIGVHDSNGCPCYDKAGGEAMIKVGPNWSVSTNGASCTSSIFITSRIYAEGSDPCDISTATNFTCNPATTLSFPSPSPQNVPTLSEWGLIILTLSLMTFGTLYLVQPSLRNSLEQEG